MRRVHRWSSFRGTLLLSFHFFRWHWPEKWIVFEMITFHEEWIPDGSVWNNLGVPSGSNPTMRVEIPKGRTPPLCVYFLMMNDRSIKKILVELQRYILWYIRRWQGHLMIICGSDIPDELCWSKYEHLEFKTIEIRIPAVNPANAKHTCLSNFAIFLAVLLSCNLRADFFSTPRTITSFPLTPIYWIKKLIQTYSSSSLFHCFQSVI